MALMPTAFVNQQEIKSAIQHAKYMFREEIDHINYNLGENWAGDPSIFFRIVMRDEAFQNDHLAKLTFRISKALMKEAKTGECGLIPYFDFRSVSEQA